MFSYFLNFFTNLLAHYWSKNDLEPRGVIFPKYEPVASHMDPFRAGFCEMSKLIF